MLNPTSLRGPDERRPLMIGQVGGSPPSLHRPIIVNNHDGIMTSREETDSVASMEIVQVPLTSGETAVNGGVAVRRNILHDAWRDATSDTRIGSNLRTSIMYTTIVIPQILACWVLLAMYGEKESCPNSLDRDISIDAWISIQSVQLCIAVVLGWQVHRSVRVLDIRATTEAGTERTTPPNVAAERRLRYWRIASFWNDLFGVLWLVKGSSVFFGEVPCNATAPHLYPLGQSLIFIAFTILALPGIACAFVVLGVCFCLPCLVRALVAMNGSSRRIKGVTPEVLASLPTVVYIAGMFANGSSPRHSGDTSNVDQTSPQCAICLGAYAVGEVVRILPCDERHHFHATCSDDWLKLNATCPVCRRPVVDVVVTRNDVENPGVGAATTETATTTIPAIGDGGSGGGAMTMV